MGAGLEVRRWFSSYIRPSFEDPFIVQDFLAKNVPAARADPQDSGKRSTTLALPINGSRLRKASDQELASLVEGLEKRALLDRVDSVAITSTDSDVVPLSFVLPV